MKLRSSSSTDAKNLRSSLGISQEEAARLLHISKNTWIRWEHGENRADVLSLRPLPFLARQECPQSCVVAQEQRVDRKFLAGHVGSCRECWLMIQYLSKKNFSKE